MNLKDFLMDGDDEADLTGEEKLERRRHQYESLKAVMEERRATLEAKGMDVDAALAEMKAMWESYEHSQHEVERTEEDYLQRTADMADAREKLLQFLRDGMTSWQESLDQAPAGSTQRVEVWEGFTAWKAQMRAMAESSLTAKNDPRELATCREALRILGG